MRFFEDFTLGTKFELSERRVTLEDIVRFAREFDPLPFHLDEDLASQSQFGGLIASGLHTVCIAASIVVTDILRDSSMAGAVGLEALRWLHPVRPGDSIRVRFTVAATEPWKRNAELGLVKAQLDVSNQEDAPVISAIVSYLFARRATSSEVS